MKRDVVPDEAPSGAQGWWFNTRRDKFKDPRIRQALGFGFDFEWVNKNIMYGLYARTRLVFPELAPGSLRDAGAGRGGAPGAVPRQGAR